MGWAFAFLTGLGRDREPLGAPHLLTAAQGRLRKRGECLEAKEDPLVTLPLVPAPGRRRALHSGVLVDIVCGSALGEACARPPQAGRK